MNADKRGSGKTKIVTTEDTEEHGEVNSRGLPISAIFGNSGVAGKPGFGLLGWKSGDFGNLF